MNAARKFLRRAHVPCSTAVIRFRVAPQRCPISSDAAKFGKSFGFRKEIAKNLRKIYVKVIGLCQMNSGKIRGKPKYVLTLFSIMSIHFNLEYLRMSILF